MVVNRITTMGGRAGGGARSGGGGASRGAQSNPYGKKKYQIIMRKKNTNDWVTMIDTDSYGAAVAMGGNAKKGYVETKMVIDGKAGY